MKRGTFYVVATPIGNLGDMTLRGLEILKSVDCILAEDTRYTAKLLIHFNIKNRVLSYRDQNHLKMVEKVKLFLDAGEDIALVSDSGTPLISDPGFKLVRELRDFGHSVFSIPGPSALISALSISGLPTDRFIFIGFLPKSKGKIESLLKVYGSLESSLVVYESPYRVKKLLQSISDVLGKDRMVFIANDLTKLKEKHFYGKVENVLQVVSQKEIKGEVVVVISKE